MNEDFCGSADSSGSSKKGDGVFREFVVVEMEGSFPVSYISSMRKMVSSVQFPAARCVQINE